MNANDREKIPPPENCKQCAKSEGRSFNGVWRWRCLVGHPMHPECCWLEPRREPVIGAMNGQ